MFIFEYLFNKKKIEQSSMHNTLAAAINHVQHLSNHPQHPSSGNQPCTTP